MEVTDLNVTKKLDWSNYMMFQKSGNLSTIWMNPAVIHRESNHARKSQTLKYSSTLQEMIFTKI